MNERTVRIKGMTCAACEETVGSAFAALPGVSFASASVRAGTVHLRGDAIPTDDALSSALAQTPYSLGMRAWLSRDASVWRDLGWGAVAVTALILAMALWDPSSRVGNLTGGLGIGSAMLVLGLGVAASLSTCMAIVGGLVLSLSASSPASLPGSAPARRGGSVATHAAFNLGRIVGFGALGAVAGVAGKAFSLSGNALAIAMIVVALATAVLGLRLTEVSPRIGAWQVTLPTSWARWARKSPSAAATSTTGRASHAKAFALGAATFFLPCGFTQVAQLLALASGSPVTGGAIMALFAVGTTPGLFAFGVAAASARGRASRRPLRIIGAVVIALAVVTGLGGLTGAGLLTPRVSATPTTRSVNVADAEGRQVVTTIVGLDGYSPEVAVVYVNEPVTWVLQPVGAGCASIVDASSLGLGELTAIFESVSSDFTPTKTGTFHYQCAMGMYAGTFTVIDRPAPAS